MLECLSVLFPKFAWSINKNYDSVDNNSLRLTHRLASEDRINFYFYLSIDEIPIGTDVLNSILKLANKENLLEYYNSFIARGAFTDFLVILQGSISSISNERIALISKTLLKTFGKSEEVNNRGLFSRSSDDLIGTCITKLLAKLNNTNICFDIFQTAVLDMDIKNMSGISILVNREELHHGRLAADSCKENEQLLQLQNLLDVEKIFVKKIKEIVKASMLFDTPNYLMPAYLWDCFDDIGYSKYVSELLNSDINKCRYIACNAEKWTYMSGVVGIGWSFSPSRFKKHLAVPDARSAIEACKNTESFNKLHPLDREKIAAFMLYTTDFINEKDYITQKKSKKLLAIWQSGGDIQDID